MQVVVLTLSIIPVFHNYNNGLGFGVEHLLGPAMTGRLEFSMNNCNCNCLVHMMLKSSNLGVRLKADVLLKYCC